MIERLKQAALLKFGGALGKDNQVNVRKYEGNGYMDCWCSWEGEDIAVEIKTKGSRDFDRITRERIPDRQHYIQCMTYAHFLGFKKLWILYMDREKHFEGRNGEIIPRWEILEFDYDPELGAKIEKRLIKLSDFKLNGKEPKKEPKTSDDPRCKYCSHRKYCWNESSNHPTAGSSILAKRIAANSTAKRRSASVA
jgi:CRISPR/Cas system-associated exonuclease Cas4 (RecB family)